MDQKKQSNKGMVLFVSLVCIVVVVLGIATYISSGRRLPFTGSKKTEPRQEVQVIPEPEQHGVTIKTEEASNDPATPDEITLPAGLERYRSLDEYYERFGDALDAACEDLSTDNVTLAIETSGNEFIVNVTITNEKGVTADIRNGLDDTVLGKADKFRQQAAQLDKALDGTTGKSTVTVRYIGPDGELLSQNSFTADE